MNKFALTLIVAAFGAASFAQCCGDKQVEAKVQSCDKKVEAKMQGCCGDKGLKPFDANDAAFLAQAEEMKQGAEGKKQCCKSTAAKPMAKGDKGCCNNGAEPAKFKVFVAGMGYKYFGCKDSAGQGRKELMASGHKVGTVQKVRSKRTIAS